MTAVDAEWILTPYLQQAEGNIRFLLHIISSPVAFVPARPGDGPTWVAAKSRSVAVNTVVEIQRIPVVLRGKGYNCDLEIKKNPIMIWTDCYDFL